jgi:general secretion pathway protein E/type IV pilus assembly protein PilB
VPSKHCVSKGCQYCHYTGYKGRKAIYEIIGIDSQLSEYIKENKLKIDDLLQNRGIQSLSDNAFALFNNGETSLEEVYSLLSNEF